MINVILADHERIFRIGMASALAAEDDIRIIGQPTTPAQLLGGLRSFRPHVLILSSAFLGCLDTIKQACDRQQTAILLLEDYGATSLLQFSADFHGVMQRSADEVTVVQCIRHLARGGRVLRLTRDSFQQMPDHTVGLRVRQRLTPKEMNISSYVVQGYKNREIALRVGTSEQSVKNALRKIFDKTGVYGRLELALFMTHHRTLLSTRAETRVTSGVASMASLQRYWAGGRESTVN